MKDEGRTPAVHNPESITEPGQGAGPATTDSGAGPRHRVRKPGARRLTWIFLTLTLLAAALVLPPLINISQYRRQVTALMSRSLGRPVRLSSIELRLLPLPGFVLHDLAVAEDPGFGVEPILSARSVVASVKLWSLWRGKLEVSRISVDEASLNLVRNAQGRWNLETLMIGAAPGLPGASPAITTQSTPFPYLEATSSRVNFKEGLEKSPYSVTDTDLSLWQDRPGEWRVRLKGQPVRTDLEMSSADTGELRLEASLHSAPQLRDMPIKLQAEWREAQLGQLSRLLLGSDAGWRGDLTLDLAVEGTVDAALTKTRLRAVGVRRAEFAPETPLDLDANCNFRYDHSHGALHDLNCDTALGEGRIHLKADLPGDTGQPHAALDVKQLPLQAGLDLLRSLRQGFAPGIAARGTAAGTLTLQQTVSVPEPPTRRSIRLARAHAAKPTLPTELTLTGDITVRGASLHGGSLKEELVLPTIVLSPAAGPAPNTSLTTSFTIASPRSADAPSSTLAISLDFTPQGYTAQIQGSATPEQLRSLAYALGQARSGPADAITGGTTDVTLNVAGPWFSDHYSTSQVIPTATSASETSQLASISSAPDRAFGTLHFHRIQWHAPYLARPVEVSEATLTLADHQSDWSADFTYGTLKGSISGDLHQPSPTPCTTAVCTPRLQLHFGTLDSAALQAALLGAPAEKSLLSPLIERLRASQRPSLPIVELTATADTLILGPVTLHSPELQLHLQEDEVTLESFQAHLLGGSAQGKGKFTWSGSGHDDKPAYRVEGQFTQISGSALGELFASRGLAGTLSGTGKVELSGFRQIDLADSAAGSFDFLWKQGSLPATVIAQPLRFSSWKGTATLARGSLELKDNQLSAKQSGKLSGSFPFSGPLHLTFTPKAR